MKAVYSAQKSFQVSVAYDLFFFLMFCLGQALSIELSSPAVASLGFEALYFLAICFVALCFAVLYFKVQYFAALYFAAQFTCPLLSDVCL